jgi:hypothetical protein
VGPIAGPSSKPASGPTGTKRKYNNRPPELSDSDDLYGPEPPPADEPPEKMLKRGSALVGAATNGKATSKGKGKAKAEPPPKTSRKTAESIEVDEVEVVEDTEVEIVSRPTARATAKSKKQTSTTNRSAKAPDKELGRLRQKLADVRHFPVIP